MNDYLSVGEVAERLERHADRVVEALAVGELFAVTLGSTVMVPSATLPPRQRPSEEAD